MRRFRMILLLLLALGALLVGVGFNQALFVWTAIGAVVVDFVAEYLWYEFGKEFTNFVRGLFYSAMPGREEKRIKAELRRAQLFVGKPNLLKRHTIVTCGTILLCWVLAGSLGLSATLPQFLIKTAPALDQGLQALNVFLSWLGMVSYVMFLLGVWYAYRLCREYNNVLDFDTFSTKCETKLTKLHRDHAQSMPHSTN